MTISRSLLRSAAKWGTSMMTGLEKKKLGDKSVIPKIPNAVWHKLVGSSCGMHDCCFLSQQSLGRKPLWKWNMNWK